MQEKVIPQSIEAEQNVLSALLIDTKAIDKAARLLKPDDFYRPDHRIIYSAMLALHDKNRPVDMLTVTEELKKRNQLDDVGSIMYITLLSNVAPTAANLKSHAEIILEKAFRRQLIESGTEIAAMGYAEDGGDIRSLINQYEQKLMHFVCRRGAQEFVPMHDLVSDVMDSMGNQLENNRTVTGLSTGFSDLDYLTAGLQPSDFIILAARPSMGKTALALNMAANIVLRGGTPDRQTRRIAFFSLEMSRHQLVQRMICSEADVDSQELRPPRPDLHSGTMQPDEAEAEEEKMDVLDRLWTATSSLSDVGIFIDDTAGLTLPELRSKARRLKADGGLDLIVIDYLQLMQTPNSHSGENRQREVSEISRGLKALARELDVPVLALSQLSRNVETRQNKRPMLSDLRESGSLEQDADLVLFLYREDYYKNKAADSIYPTELIVAKHRNGPTGKIDLFFKSDCTKFIGASDLDRE